MNVPTTWQATVLSLRGLTVGDAFGQSFFISEEQAVRAIQERQAPPPPWQYTDDTLQALSLVTVLLQYGIVEQDAFASSLAQGYQPDRGYGPGMHNHLARLRAGEPWREVATSRNDGAGSLGNGAAMRVAPLGAYFAEDLSAVATQAALSAKVTHTHPEAIAGAIAVAIAAAIAWRFRHQPPSFQEFFDAIIAHVPDSAVREGIGQAATIRSFRFIDYPVAILGNGSLLTCADTVPIALWCAAQRLTHFEEALWLAVSALGDRDTICAIVGGIVGLIAPPPEAWLAWCESIPGSSAFSGI